MCVGLRLESDRFDRRYCSEKRDLATPGVDADIPNNKMQYPLHFAAFKLHPKVVILIESIKPTKQTK
jgi:hypothetical protein